MNDTARDRCEGGFVDFLGEKFYRIRDYYDMDDFFMSVVSSSDVWNFCWAQGGITAGRVDCDRAVFPYYTADKVSDARTYTGAYAAIKVEQGGSLAFWEPFAGRESDQWRLERSIYKNKTGTKVYFEEKNLDLGLTFQYGWTSSARYGLVRHARIVNDTARKRDLAVLDGCRNILPACASADFQNSNSVLLDAYKKTDLDTDTGLALFAVSSIVSDKAEPNEGLYANTCWFSAQGAVKLAPRAPELFRRRDQGEGPGASEAVLKGQRASCFLDREIELEAGRTEEWYQVFDTRLDSGQVASLRRALRDRAEATRELERDIADGVALMESYLAQADGMQDSAAEITAAHHEANVMFNIMRGGLFVGGSAVSADDFLRFVGQRNKGMVAAAERLIAALPASSRSEPRYLELKAAATASGDAQLSRITREYLPLSFSRRHGDPSRPWNRFSIALRDDRGRPILNYEGNWRDIFQNWEALAMSYPIYLEGMVATFLDSMTSDGFNPYRITRAGIDWEIPEPDNPWAQIGYWGDHQVIYLEKLLEMSSRFGRAALLATLDEPRYTTSNVPYRLKGYADIRANPRDTIRFDRELSTKLQKAAAALGGDAKMLMAEDGSPRLVSMSAKLLQILIAKLANLVPGGGIWLNTQRPEWNDANNALAGYGLSVVTLCYLHRFLGFLIELYGEAKDESFALPEREADCFQALARLYASVDPAAVASDAAMRSAFMDEAGAIYQAERDALYAEGIGPKTRRVAKAELIAALDSFRAHARESIRSNKRPDGLYHAYNTMTILEGRAEIERLPAMLEGQVAILSAGFLSPAEALALLTALKSSALFDPERYSYILYPDKELPSFLEKNRVSAADTRAIPELAAMLDRGDERVIYQDCEGVCHFEAGMRNASVLRKTLCDIDSAAPAADAICALYEKTFHHQSFTGRSGTFYAYEGLGSIYWHMVAKLMLAAQENALAAKDPAIAAALAAAYYDIRAGIGFNKTPERYGAFPADPYSHTPKGQGAKQPGMTGQVKEEILTRWGELGVSVADGIASFEPRLLKLPEFKADGSLGFSCCGTPIVYRLGDAARVSVNGAEPRPGSRLSADESRRLFERDGGISKIEVWVERSRCLA